MTFKKHVIVLGTARSGTSWLSETLSQPSRYRMLFEPEHETRTTNGRLICDLWLDQQTHSIQATNYLKRVFKNQVDCDWIAQNSNRKFKRHLWPFIPKKFIIKFVRANLSGTYMSDTFGIPIIHLLRNPYDTLKSQRQVRFPWLFDLNIFESQSKLKNVLLKNYGIDLRNWKAFSELEILSIRWCIENVIPLEYQKIPSSNYSVIKYEELVENSDLLIELCQRYDLELVTDFEDIFKRPSSKTHPTVNFKTNKKNELGWSTDELTEINTILDRFQSKLYPRNY